MFDALRSGSLLAALGASLATSSAAPGPSWTASDTLVDTATVAGAGSTQWSAGIDNAAMDFFDGDTLVVEATTAGIGGILELHVTANGQTLSNTIALGGGDETTARVELHDVLPGCTPGPLRCETLIELAFVTNIPVEVDLVGVLTVGGGGDDTPSVELVSP